MRTISPLAVRYEQTEDRQLNQVQRNIHEWLNVLAAYGPLWGNTLTQTFAAGQNLSLDHGLGRQPIGWMVWDARTAAAEIYRTAWDAKTISLTSVNAGSYTLRVF